VDAANSLIRQTDNSGTYDLVRPYTASSLPQRRGNRGEYMKSPRRRRSRDSVESGESHRSIDPSPVSTLPLRAVHWWAWRFPALSANDRANNVTRQQAWRARVSKRFDRLGVRVRRRRRARAGVAVGRDRLPRSVRPSITAPDHCPKIFFQDNLGPCHARRPVLMFLSLTYPAATGASMQICDVHPCM
jgi:hypothetical protein